MPKRVFISYRRQDTAPAAGRVYDRLCQLLSKHNVFFDVSTIAGGKEFMTEVAAAIQKSDAVLVFIGRKYLEPTAEGIVRLLEAEDHVRAEVRAALQKQGQKSDMVLPVLVDGAVMPQPEQLPEDIRAICTRNALPLRHESFDDDTENVLKTILGVSAKERIWDEKTKLSTKFGYAFAGLLAGLALWVLCGLLYFWLWGHFLAESIGNEANIALLTAVVATGAWMGFRYEAGRRKRRLQGLI